MEKIVLIAVVLLFAGCHSLDRVNPTDPQAGSYYKGMTYLGEIGSFAVLTDFTVAQDPSPYIFAVDGSNQQIDQYGLDGTPINIIQNPAPPLPQAFFYPTGICEMGGYCYVIDTVNTVAFNIVTSAGWQDPTVKGNKILAFNNTLYAVVSDPPGVAPYTPYVTPPPYYTAGAPWIITKGDTTCASCMSYISDITVNTNTSEILLVDSVLKRISIFTPAGTWVRNINVGTDILGAAVWELSDTLYVPTTDGIRKYNYTSGSYIGTIANYGEGNGRVMNPGKIVLYQSPAPDNKYYIFVGTGTFIKVFQISGL